MTWACQSAKIANAPWYFQYLWVPPEHGDSRLVWEMGLKMCGFHWQFSISVGVIIRQKFFPLLLHPHSARYSDAAHINGFRNIYQTVWNFACCSLGESHRTHHGDRDPNSCEEDTASTLFLTVLSEFRIPVVSMLLMWPIARQSGPLIMHSHVLQSLRYQIDMGVSVVRIGRLCVAEEYPHKRTRSVQERKAEIWLLPSQSRSILLPDQYEHGTIKQNEWTIFLDTLKLANQEDRKIPSRLGHDLPGTVIQSVAYICQSPVLLARRMECGSSSSRVSSLSVTKRLNSLDHCQCKKR